MKFDIKSTELTLILLDVQLLGTVPRASGGEMKENVLVLLICFHVFVIHQG